MTHLNLGILEGPLLLFGGPYSNLQATRALKGHAERLGIPPSHIICTGDAVAYFAKPNETVELLREWGVNVLMGNCEESLGWVSDDCGCGFEKGSTCDLLTSSWYPYANSVLTDTNRQWMRSLKRVITFTYNDRQFTVVHGSYKKMNQFVFASTYNSLKEESLISANSDGIIAGHCGIPFTQIINDKLWHNPGVIGMPANDGTPRTWFSLWFIKDKNIVIEHRALDYNYEKTADELLLAGSANAYVDSVKSGLWPSMDVLPAKEKAQQGKSLQETIIRY